VIKPFTFTIIRPHEEIMSETFVSLFNIVLVVWIVLALITLDKKGRRR